MFSCVHRVGSPRFTVPPPYNWAVKKSDFPLRSAAGTDCAAAACPSARPAACSLSTLPTATFADRHFTDLPDYLRAGDLLVFNDTRVLAGASVRTQGNRRRGGNPDRARARRARSARAARRQQEAEARQSRIVLDDGSTIRVLGREGEFYTLRFDSAEPLEKLLAQARPHAVAAVYFARRRRRR